VLRVHPADDVMLRAYRIEGNAEPFECSASEYEIVGVAQTTSDASQGQNSSMLGRFAAIRFGSGEARSQQRRRLRLLAQCATRRDLSQLTLLSRRLGNRCL
jgi:hypothetical protein